ncbi:MAG: hypothetical protein RR319_07405 [Bacteroides sp.]
MAVSFILTLHPLNLLTYRKCKLIVSPFAIMIPMRTTRVNTKDKGAENDSTYEGT